MPRARKPKKDDEVSSLDDTDISVNNIANNTTNNQNTLNKQFNSSSYLLMILLIIRIFGQLAFVGVDFLLFVLFETVYIVALVGIFLKRRWGSIVAMIIGVIDILLARARGERTLTEGCNLATRWRALTLNSIPRNHTPPYDGKRKRTESVTGLGF